MSAIILCRMRPLFSVLTLLLFLTHSLSLSYALHSQSVCQCLSNVCLRSRTSLCRTHVLVRLFRFRWAPVERLRVFAYNTLVACYVTHPSVGPHQSTRFHSTMTYLRVFARPRPNRIFPRLLFHSPALAMK